MNTSHGNRFGALVSLWAVCLAIIALSAGCQSSTKVCSVDPCVQSVTTIEARTARREGLSYENTVTPQYKTVLVIDEYGENPTIPTTFVRLPEPTDSL